MPIPVFTDGIFKLGPEHGFLPIVDPIVKLPSRYEELQDVLDHLHRYTLNTENDDIFQIVHNLHDYLDSIKLESDKRLLVALYRGYCFLSSAYLLYPSYSHFCKTGDYGTAHAYLPNHLARPLIYLAEQLEVFPWLEYSYGYSLCNYHRLDPTRGLDYDNLKMAVSFSGTPDENGFIMVHVDINQHTPKMMEHCNQIYDAFLINNTESILPALEGLIAVLQSINTSRKRMWEASRWQRYNDFRIYIMGIQGNTSIFPNGVLYGYEKAPRYYRGQSGSQDSIIPFLDSFFRVCDFYESNELTEYLKDMRQYRPKPFRQLIQWVENNTLGLPDWLVAIGYGKYLIEIYREIYNFRNGHWQFVQKYIMSNTKYATATGGTPIISWIPNQIKATLDAMKWTIRKSGVNYPDYDDMTALLTKQLDELRNKNYNPETVYQLNEKFKKVD